MTGMHGDAPRHTPSRSGQDRPCDPLPDWDPDEWWDDEEPGADDQDGWLAGLPADVRAQFEAGPYTGQGEVLGCGFTHRDRSDDTPLGAGFAAGGTLDGLVPGPWLAKALAGATWDEDGHASPEAYFALGESELVGVLCAWQRLTSWAQAGQAAAAFTLAVRRKVQAREAPVRIHLADHVDDEVAAALAMTGRSAGRLLEVSAGLARLQEVYAALEAGQIDWPKACLFVDMLANLDVVTARKIAGRLLGRAGAMTTGQLRNLLARAVLDADPAAAERRKQDAAKDTDVQAWTETSGNAALAGRELPPADVIAADRRLTALARWLQKHGASGTVSQLRAQVYIALLGGRPVDSLLPSRDHASPNSTRPDSASPDSASPDPASPNSTSPDPGCPGPASHNPASHNPAGHNPASHNPAAGDAGERSDDTPSRDNPSRDNPSRDNPSRDEAPSRDDEDGPTGNGGWPDLGGTVNLTVPLSAWARLSEASGEVAGHGPADAATCRDLVARMGPSTRWCLTLTDDSGRPAAHACARDVPPPGQAVIRWASGLREKLKSLESGTCSHGRRSPGYRPPGTLTHLVKIRQLTCSFPGCRRASARCDLDHTIAYDKGGITCECNLSPLCRRHHRAKQTFGWHLVQAAPGVMTWYLPHERSYQTTGEPYPG